MDRRIGHFGSCLGSIWRKFHCGSHEAGDKGSEPEKCLEPHEDEAVDALRGLVHNGEVNTVKAEEDRSQGEEWRSLLKRERGMIDVEW